MWRRLRRTRGDLDSHVVETGQVLVSREAPLGFTRSAALVRSDANRGFVRPGMRADLTIRGENWLPIDAEQLCEIPINATTSGGRSTLRSTDAVVPRVRYPTGPIPAPGRFHSWGTWTRTKNKRIRIFRVANYTIPQWPRPKPRRRSTLAHDLTLTDVAVLVVSARLASPPEALCRTRSSENTYF